MNMIYIGTMSNGKFTRKNKAFLDAYFGEAGRNASEAARLVGYKGSGSKLLIKLDVYVQKRERELAEKAHMTAEQVVSKLADIAKNDKNPAQQVRALEILSKIHGLHSDKVNVHLDKQALTDDLDKALAKLTTFAITDPSTLQPRSALPQA